MATTNILDLNNRIEQLEKSGGGSGGGGAADDVTYDPTASGLQATNVQDAIDEVASDLSGLSADDVTYDNTDSGLSSDTVQGAIDETVNKIDNINDDLNGFCFYPVGTAIVGLVSDDSPYTDANGNYILAASTTGQSMIDDVTYKSINSTVDARGKVGADSATPFSKGIELTDINPTKSTALTVPGVGLPQGFGGTPGIQLSVGGYDKIAICNYSSSYKFDNMYFVYDDGTESPATAISTYAGTTWSPYYSIPDNCVLVRFNVAVAGTAAYLFYSLLTKDSPYNV